MAAPVLRVAILAAVLLLPFLSVPPGAEAQTKKFCLTQFAIASQACAILPPTSPEHHHHDDEDDDEDEDEDEDEDDEEDEDDGGGGGDEDDDDNGGGERRRRGRGRDLDKQKSGVVVSRRPTSVAGNESASSMITVEAEVDNDRNGTTHSAVGNRTRDGSGGGGGGARRHGSSSRHRRRRRRRHHHRRHRRGRLRDGEDDGGEDDGGEDEDGDEDEDEDEDEDGDEDEDEDEDDDDDDDDHRAYRDCCRWLKEVEPDCVCEALLRLPPFLVRPQHKYTVKVGHSCKFTYRCGGI